MKNLTNKPAKHKLLKYPRKPYIGNPPSKTISIYKQIEIKDRTLKNLMDELPEHIKLEDVQFNTDHEIDYGYYNEPSVGVSSIHAYYSVEEINPNYDKLIQIYTLSKQKYDEDLKKYKKDMKAYEEQQVELQIEHAKKCVKKIYERIK